jgi:hypothetical protein
MSLVDFHANDHNSLSTGRAVRICVIEHADPGGVSWMTRKPSPALWSTSSRKPALLT